ncbi:MAG TPA: DMT family transporter [Acetobacteraceae bacterium]|nr:DMT family transporter [Acetobacteraceae bacterium]
MWYFYALLGPAIWALLNHLDKYLLGHFFKEDAAGPVLVVFTGFAGLIVAIVILLFNPSVFTLTLWQELFVMGAGALLVASYVPYMIAMQRDEASIVASLYRLAPLFVFVLSYVTLGESLRPRQIAGGLVTIVGSVSLIVDFDKTGRGFNLSTLFLMSAACFMNACTVVIFKFIALEASFWNSAFWEYIGAGAFSVALICGMPSYRRALFALLRSREAYVLVPITLAGEAFNVLANLAVGFAGLMAPLALVSIVTGLHPFFVLAYGILFTRLLPAFGRERLTWRHVSQKIVAIGVMCVGIAITFTC